MSVAAIGSNITVTEDASAPLPTPDPANQYVPEPETAPEPELPPIYDREPSADLDAFRAALQADFNAAVADIERRLGQARDIERANETGVPRQMVHAEDLNINKFMIDGYTLTANSPTAGRIAWASLHVVLLGIDYTITDANTNLKYSWFVKPGSYTPGTPIPLQSSDTLPVLGAGDALIFINNGGTPISVLESSIAYAVGPGVVGNAQLDTTTQTLLSTLSANDAAQQARIDGVITSYYQDTAPWPSGALSPAAVGSADDDINMGDIWYDANDGGAYRWTGASGTPANTWFRIADTDTSALAGKVNTKVSTYITTNAAPPAAPAGGFSTGDMWIVTDRDNLVRRWSGAAWVDIQLGDLAISGVSGAKIGTGINGSNVTTGTVVAARVGSGVANVSLAGVTGTLGAANLAANAVTPSKINAAFHLLY